MKRIVLAMMAVVGMMTAMAQSAPTSQVPDSSRLAIDTVFMHPLPIGFATAGRSEYSEYSEYSENSDKSDGSDKSDMSDDLRSAMRMMQAVGTRIDSTVTYDIDGNHVSTTEYQYDAAGHTVATITYQWIDGVKTGGDYTLYTYTNNRITQETVYTWDAASGAYIGSKRTTYTFNNAGLQTLQLIEVWEPMIGDWMFGEKYEYDFDASNRQTRSEYAVMDMEAFEWEVQSRQLWTYDAAGHTLTNIMLQINAVTHSLDSLRKYENAYDASNRLVVESYYSSYNNGWIGSWKHFYEYDSRGNTLNKEDYSGWENGDWKGSNKETNVYDNANNSICKILYSWSAGEWVNKTKNEKAYNAANNVVDNAMYSWSNSAWKGTSRTAYYWENNVTMADTAFAWVNGEWEYKTLKTYTYEGTQAGTTATYTWKNEAWQAQQRVVYTYTASGSVLCLATQGWCGEDWCDSIEVRHYYDERNNDTLTVTQKWQNGEWTPTAQSRMEVTYDEQGRKITEIKYTWVKSTDTWKGASNYVYAYDANGNKVLEERFTYTNYTWTLSYRRINVYDAANHLLLDELYQASGSVLVGISKSESAYEGNTRVMTASYLWDNSHSDFRGVSKTEDIYVNGVKVSSVSYKWDYTNWAWVEMFKYEYNSSGRNSETITSRWNTTTDAWDMDTRSITVYDTRNHLIASNSYTYRSDEWQLTSQSEKVYDEDAEGKLRVTIDGSWSNGVLNSYAEVHYFYNTDTPPCETVYTEAEYNYCYGEMTEWGFEAQIDSLWMDTLLTAAGCDSVVTRIVYVPSPLIVMEDDPIRVCEGEEVLWRGISITEPGIYEDMLFNRLGCDSFLYEVEVIYLESTEVFFRDTICEGQVYYFYEQELTVSGEYEQVVTNSMGCDSIIITLNLEVEPCQGTDVENIRNEEHRELDSALPMYNILGVPVDERYQGIVIQEGKRYLR